MNVPSRRENQDSVGSKPMNPKRIMRLGSQGKLTSAEELANSVDDDTFCICYFGGDPTVQMPYAMKALDVAKSAGLTRVHLGNIHLLGSFEGADRIDLIQ